MVSAGTARQGRSQTLVTHSEGRTPQLCGRGQQGCVQAHSFPRGLPGAEPAPTLAPFDQGGHTEAGSSGLVWLHHVC